jgi:hypothetical protein
MSLRDVEVLEGDSLEVSAGVNWTDGTPPDLDFAGKLQP